MFLKIPDATKTFPFACSHDTGAVKQEGSGFINHRYMKHLANTILLFLLVLAMPAMGEDSRPRLLVLTDIGGDPDDQQSLVRLLVYANEFNIEGLIASASGTPGELKKALVQPQLIREQVAAYANVYGNLTQHAQGYPTPEHLLTVIKSGNPQRGRQAVGDGKDTEGSRLIVERGNRPDQRPLNIVIWGGQTDLAQACWDVRKEYGQSGLKNFLSRIRVYDIADQDRIFEWMRREFDFPFYILNKSWRGHDMREAVFRGMYLGGDESLTSREWVESNIRSDHGSLGALYPAKTWTAPNPHSALKEGDTPSFFYFLADGLNDPGFPNHGGWGGRFLKFDGIWRDAVDRVDGVSNGRSSVSRWRPAFQNEFQARLDWCVAPPSEANHAPLAVVNGDRSRSVLRLSVHGGKPISLDASESSDPDQDQLNYHWWVYPEAGTVGAWELQQISWSDPHTAKTTVTLPPGKPGATAHLILEVRDDGEPSLTRYRRVILKRTH